MQGIKDRYGRLNELQRGSAASIELGCGPTKRIAESIGVDILDFPGVDIIGSAIEVLRAMPTACAREISSSHFLEHVDDLPGLLTETMRVLEVGGKLVVTVPHFSNALFYSDPTHKTFFGLYTFSYFFDGDLFKRTTPGYARIPGGLLTDVRLGFRSYRPHYLSHAIRRTTGLLVNASKFLMETYEESFSSWISCYEITYEVTRADS